MTVTKEIGDRLEEAAENLDKNNSLRADRNTALAFYYNRDVPLTWRLTDSAPAWVSVTALAVSGTATTYR